MIYHPTTPSDEVERIKTHIHFEDDNLHLRYHLTGQVTQLLIPENSKPIKADGLWEHTCFEVFLAVEGEPDYYEFNFSPSTKWAAYGFSAYRENKPWDISLPPVITVQQSDNELILAAVISKKSLPLVPDKRWQINVTAVIENNNKEKSYWALTHPTAQPDFHHRDGFSYEIWPG
jgi:hypothetical protein